MSTAIDHPGPEDRHGPGSSGGPPAGPAAGSPRADRSPGRLVRSRRRASGPDAAPQCGPAGCDVAVPAGAWRLTDRGIAVVLVLAVMITVAAVTVIGLTAWQVTGADYQPAAGPARAAVSAR